MPLIAPPPKPGGRTRVYRVIAKFQPSQPDQLELAVDDLVYLREAGPGEGGLCQLKRAGDGRIGLFPRDAVTAHLEPIEFPLQEAAKMGDWDFLRECLENKVSVNSLDKSGSTALHWAAYTGHAEIVANLLAIPNIAISAQNKLGDSPLHAASAKGRLDCAELLVEAGANVHAKNGQGKRALDVAAQPEIGALLRTTMAARAANRAEEEDYLEGDEDEETGSQG